MFNFDEPTFMSESHEKGKSNGDKQTETDNCGIIKDCTSNSRVK